MFVSDIAKDFVQEYYIRLLTNEGDLRPLYHPQAYLDHGREGKPSVQTTFKGPEAVKSALKWHANTKIMITDITGIPYHTNQVLVLVLGDLLRESATESNSFSHTLILTKRRSGKHQILVDVFRLLEPQNPGFNLRPTPPIGEPTSSEPQLNKLPIQPSADSAAAAELNGDADAGAAHRSSSVPRTKNQRRWKEQKENKLKKKDSVSPAAPPTDPVSPSEPKPNGEAKPDAKKANNKPKDFTRNYRGRPNPSDKLEAERGNDAANDQNPRNGKIKDSSKPTDLKSTSPLQIPKEPSKDANQEPAKETTLRETPREPSRDRDLQESTKPSAPRSEISKSNGYRSELPKPEAPKSERNLRPSPKPGSDHQDRPIPQKPASARSDSAGSDHSEKRSFKFTKDAFAKASKFQPPKSYSNVTSPQIAVPNMVPTPAAMQYAPQMYAYGYPMAFPSQGAMMGYPPALGSPQPNPRYGPVPTQHYPNGPPFNGHQNYPDPYAPNQPMNQHQHQPAMGQQPYP